MTAQTEGVARRPSRSFTILYYIVYYIILYHIISYHIILYMWAKLKGGSESSAVEAGGPRAMHDRALLGAARFRHSTGR